MTSSNKNTYLLVITNCINKIYDIFLGMFMVSFLFRKTQESVTDISIYHLFCYIFVAILAYLTGNWIKRGNRLLMYQLGIVTTFIGFMFFIYLQDDIINYIPFCGIVFGIIMSFKAFPFNLIVADNIPASKMIAFKGYLESIKNIIRVASPLILGFFLTFDSYFKTVAFLTFLSVIEFILFGQIKSPAHKKLPPIDIKTFWQKSKKLAYVKQLYKIEFCRGMTLDGTLGTLITLYTVYLFKTDFKLGLISSVFYGITILLNFCFGRYCKYHHFVKILAISATLVISSVLMFIFVPNKASFIFYNFCFTIVMQFVRVIIDINMFNVANLPEVIEYKNEYFVIRELFLGLGRIVSYGMLLLLGIYDNFAILKYFLLFLTVFVVIMSLNGIYLNRYSDKHKD